MYIVYTQDIRIVGLSLMDKSNNGGQARYTNDDVAYIYINQYNVIPGINRKKVPAKLRKITKKRNFSFYSNKTKHKKLNHVVGNIAIEDSTNIIEQRDDIPSEE